MTTFIVAVESSSDENATAYGTAYLSEATDDGQAFFDEVMVLSGNTGQLVFNVNDYYSIVNYGSSASFGAGGSFTVVPESSTVAAVAGVAALAVVFFRRKRRTA